MVSLHVVAWAAQARSTHGSERLGVGSETPAQLFDSESFRSTSCWNTLRRLLRTKLFSELVYPVETLMACTESEQAGAEACWAACKKWHNRSLHACIQSSMHACVHPCMHSSIHACIHSFIHACMHAFMRIVKKALAFCLWIDKQAASFEVPYVSRLVGEL